MAKPYRSRVERRRYLNLRNRIMRLRRLSTHRDPFEIFEDESIMKPDTFDDLVELMARTLCERTDLRKGE